ncbi:tetratricopeptide repeat protein [Acaryochloris sp. IP29b_bin.137]|uniref:tetratricopeptide repeat protein n=1 Tax=Acaryochloris sp. IP29b_bin.137 TaxID=2969217 RepID=UPI002623B2F6|nr:tetratricopeptide repeat protein [Acaryochloris sp. IP29b_bin.137]
MNNPDALINRANKRAINGDMDGALGDFDEAIALNPARATAYFNRGFLYNTLGKFEAAIHDFSEAIALLPDYDEAYYQRGNSYRQLGNFQRAILDYSEAIRINPYCIKAYYKRAESRADLGDHSGALTDYSQVILRVPKDANAYCQRGIFLSQSGELAKAIEDFSTAIEHNPRLADAYFHRGYCFAQLGEAEKASQDFSEALLHDPNHQAAYTRAYTLGMLKESPAESTSTPAPDYSLSILEESVPVTAESVEDTPTDSEFYPTTVPLEPTALEDFFERANNRIQRGDLDGAIADYTKIIEQDPHNSQAYYQRGQSLEALGESQAAMEDLSLAIHWARVHSLGLMRDFSGELSTTLKALKQDLADLSYQSPFETTNQPSTTSSPEPQPPDPPSPPPTIDLTHPSQTEEGSSPSTPKPSKPPSGYPTHRPTEIPTIDIPSNPIQEKLKFKRADIEAPTSPDLDSNPLSSEPKTPDAAPNSLDHSIEALTREIERNPLDADAFFNRGQSRALAGDLQGAIEDYSRTIRLDPNNREAYVKRARCRSALGDEVAAQDDLNHAIRYQPIRPPKPPARPASPSKGHRVQPQPPDPSSQYSRQQNPAHSPQSAERDSLQPPSPSDLESTTQEVASLFQQENEVLQSSQAPATKPCTHAGNSPGNQFCIHCGEPLDPLSPYSVNNLSGDGKSQRPTPKPALSNHKQRLQEAEKHYDQGLSLFKAGDRQGSLQSLSTGLKIFLEQREMQRYQQTLNLMQDVAHALNDTGQDEAEPDDSLLL